MILSVLKSTPRERQCLAEFVNALSMYCIHRVGKWFNIEKERCGAAT